MFKVVFSLALAVATIAPAHAVTTIVVNPSSTAITASNAVVFRDFTTANPNGTTLTTITNGTFSGGTFSEAKSVGVGGVNTTEATLAGMVGDYLTIGRNASYTISFVNNPVSFFSFAFSNIVQQSTLILNYVGGTSDTYTHPSAILGGSDATFGRVSYHTGTGPQISSVTFLRNNTGQTAFTVDSFAAAVPEPATWLMMILGFGLVGSQLRRRRGKAALAAA